jgi:alpha-glucosidase
MLVGEVYLLDLRQVVEYINSGDELHLAHNFVFVHLPWDARAFRVSVEEFEDLAEDHAWPAWFLENHDHPRVATRYANDRDPASGERRARVALMLVCAMRGTPFVYQGEELGLADAVIPPDRVVDVDGRDGERAPIPWRRPSGAGAAAGFSSGTPWLPIVPDAERLSVESQEQDPDSTLAFTRRLIGLRTREPALQSGSQRSIDAARDVFCFVRELGQERFAVVLNFSSRRTPARIGEALGADAALALSTHTARLSSGRIDLRKLVLEPDEGIIFRLE